MAQESKKGFVLYYDYRQHLSLLSDEERGKLLMALLDYGESNVAPELDGAARMAFSFIASQIDRDTQKYAETCKKRSEAGKKGGRPSKPGNPEEAEEAKKANAFSGKQTKAKKGDTDTETNTETNKDTNKDTDTDTETETDTDTNTSPHTPQGGKLPDKPTAEPAPYKVIVNLYHEICKSYPTLRQVSESRKKAIAARWREYGYDMRIFRELFVKAEASPFLKGKNQRNWTADFNWLMNSTNMAKVLEGKYDDPAAPPAGAPHQGGQQSAPSAPSSLGGFSMAVLDDDGEEDEQ